MGAPNAPLITKLERYEPLSAEEIEALEAAPSRVEVFTRHDVIVHQGDHPVDSFLVLEGVVCRFKLLPTGSRQILAFELAGDFADLQSMYLKTMDHGLEALSSARVAKVPHSTIRNLMTTYPRIARALAWDMAIDGAIQREWMTIMGRRSSYQHAAHILCEMLIRLQIVGLADKDSYQLPITQADLADAFGISTVRPSGERGAPRRVPRPEGGRSLRRIVLAADPQLSKSPVGPSEQVTQGLPPPEREPPTTLVLVRGRRTACLKLHAKR